MLQSDTLPAPRWEWLPANIQVFTGANATRANIQGALAALASTVTTNSQSMVLLYMSTHMGATTATLATADGQGITNTELTTDTLNFVKGVPVVVILDCDNGAYMFNANCPPPLYRHHNNTAFMTSTNDGERKDTGVAAGQPHSLYTQGLLNACLTAKSDLNSNNIAEFNELHAAAKRYVSVTEARFGGFETPQTMNDYWLEATFARDYPPTAPIPVSAPTGIVASDGSFTGGVMVTWNGVWASGGGGMWYLVFRSDDNTTATRITVSNWQQERVYLDRSASPLKTYYYTVMASNGQRWPAGFEPAHQQFDLNVSPMSGSDTGYRGLDATKFVDLTNGLPLPVVPELDPRFYPDPNALLDPTNYPVTTDPLLRTGVAWAVGYNYLSFQKNKAQGTLPDDLPRVISPFFVYANGGANVLSDAFALLKGVGGCTIDEFSVEGIVIPGTTPPQFEAVPPTAAQYANAALNKASGAGTFFAHTAKVKNGAAGGAVLASRYSNNVNVLRQWLASGDCFVLAMPVFPSFLNYTGGVSHAEVYDADASREFLQGFHAVCVAGYDDSKQAFLVVNSWGPTWGTNRPSDTTMNGYCWIGYNFVKKYGEEAWRMGFASGFVTQQYDVTYNGALYDPHVPPPVGISFTDAQGIVITDSSPAGQLKIKLKRGVFFGDVMPQVKTNGGLAKLYTDAPIKSLSATGIVGSLTARNCVVTSLKADGGLGAVTMSSTANTLWATLAQRRVQASPRAFTFNKNPAAAAPSPGNPALSMVQSAGAISTRMSLTGVQLAGLNLPTSGLSISLVTKKNKVGIVPYLSVAGLTSGTISVGSLPKLQVKGGNFDSPSVQTMAGGIGSIAVSGQPFTDIGGGLPVWIGGNMTLGTLYARGAIGSIATTGGNLHATSITADLNIGSLSARLATLRAGKSLFFLGADYVVGQTLAGLSQGSPDANILSVFGATGVNGQFIAGALPDLTPDKRGFVGTIGTDKRMPPGRAQPIPLIQGGSWSNLPVKFVGGDPRLFVQH
jgi:hypothetical protein